jgi:hypothetical protein
MDGSINQSTWNKVTGKPSNFPTSWELIKGKPTDLAAPTGPIYDDSEIRGMINTKAPLIHKHTMYDIQGIDSNLSTMLTDYLSGYALSDHQHSYQSITGLSEYIDSNLNTKSAIGHKHNISDINNLQSVIDSNLPNLSGYATSSALTTGLGTKQNTLTAGENISISGNTISASQPNLSGSTTIQLNTKQDTITGAATTITTADLTANRALISNGSSKVGVSTVTSTELGYLSSVTSSLQSQLNAAVAALAILQSVPPKKDSTPHFVGSLDGSDGFSILLSNGNAYVTKCPQISLGYGRTLSDPPLLTNVQKIVHGVYHSIFILNDGNVKTRGYATEANNLGYIHASISRNSPGLIKCGSDVIRQSNATPKVHSIYGYSLIWISNSTSIVWLDVNGDVWHGETRMPVIGTTNGKRILKKIHHNDKMPFYFLDDNKNLYSAVQHYGQYAIYARLGRASSPATSWTPALVDIVGGSRGKPVKSVHILNDSFRIVLENNDVYDTTTGSMVYDTEISNGLRDRMSFKTVFSE